LHDFNLVVYYILVNIKLEEASMLTIRIVALAVVLCGAIARAQEALPSAISSAYGATLKSMQSAKTPEDIRRMVEAMDARDWVSIAPNGDTMSAMRQRSSSSACSPFPPVKDLFRCKKQSTLGRTVRALSLCIGSIA
jgi:hypothetical protein